MSARRPARVYGTTNRRWGPLTWCVHREWRPFAAILSSDGGAHLLLSAFGRSLVVELPGMLCDDWSLTQISGATPDEIVENLRAGIVTRTVLPQAFGFEIRLRVRRFRGPYTPAESPHL